MIGTLQRMVVLDENIWKNNIFSDETKITPCGSDCKNLYAEKGMKDLIKKILFLH
ncbi:hypothetical protein H311_00737 [Anncaliia algerae PRA109]|nr:hypothetical protein H311_00737 [Anncaliia algerae PRA109]